MHINYLNIDFFEFQIKHSVGYRQGRYVLYHIAKFVYLFAISFF
jgi:hypothetical protein